MTIKVLLVDDHGMMRQGLKALLERESTIEVIGEAADGREAIEKVQTLTPDIVLMDISMEGLNGLEAARAICHSTSDTRVIILSMHKNDEFIIQSFVAGVKGYILKQDLKNDLLEAIHRVHDGQEYLSPQVSHESLKTRLSQVIEAGVTSQLDLLTRREREILQLIAEGLSSPEIAVRLTISPKTVERHRANLMEKLHIHHTVGLVHFAIKAGLVHLGKD